MPQSDPYPLHVDDSTTIFINHGQLPGDFKSLSPQQQEIVARKTVREHIKKIEAASRPTTFADFAIPIGLLIVLALIILWVAKKIRDNPKVYDNVVRVDGEPNPDYGKGWKDKAAK